MTSTSLRRSVKMMLLIGFAGMGLSGCDYWPPALQAQIEQMQVEAQTAAAERAKVQGQLVEAIKAKDELQVRVDELTRSNRELSGRVAGLEQTLASEREKVSRLAKASSKPAPVKTVVKTTAKSAVKKKATKATKTTTKKRN
jgi:hypothetical protein